MELDKVLTLRRTRSFGLQIEQFSRCLFGIRNIKDMT
jgi:hypothetical protein